MHGKIKRPDFLVGIPTIGTIAVDVKAKRVYADSIIIDAEEHRTLANLSREGRSLLTAPRTDPYWRNSRIRLLLIRP